jgi:hypothetical protein
MAAVLETIVPESSSSSLRSSLPAAKLLSFINNSSGSISALCALTSSESAKQNFKIAAMARLSKCRIPFR